MTFSSLNTDPKKVEAWQERSRERRIEKERKRAAGRKPGDPSSSLAPVSKRRHEQEVKGERPRRSRRARNSTMREGGGFAPASDAQREAVRGRACVWCGAPDVDPAHLTSRANPHGENGCDHPLCVLPLCRRCHDIFDGRTPGAEPIDLAAVLALPEYALHRAHMAEHMTFPMALQRLTGTRWRPVELTLERDDPEAP